VLKQEKSLNQIIIVQTLGGHPAPAVLQMQVIQNLRSITHNFGF